MQFLTSKLLGLGLIAALAFVFFLPHSVEQPVIAPQKINSSSTYCGVPPVPDPIVLEQPDGQTFQAYLFTEGPVAYLETVDGFTILQDQADQYYRYATRGLKGDLFLTGVPVSAMDQRTSTEQALLQAIRPNLRFEGQKLASLLAADQLKTDDDDDPPVSAVFPPAGVQKAILLLIDYPDQLFTYDLQAFDNMANQPGYSVNGSSGSFRDYYIDISYGLLTVNTDVEGWYTAENNRATYGIESLANRNFRNAVPLIREAVDAAEAAGVDWSQYDGDGDGRVDVVEVIHSGRGAEESSNVADIWSHRWVLAAEGLSVTYDGKIINDYIIQPEKYGSTNIANIGVLVHEFGHALGLPDLYDTDGSSRGIGRWCCMAGGTWNNGGRTPAHFSAWCKEELGWIDPVELSGSGSITDMDFSDNTDETYRFNTPDSDQYFLLENRQKTGWDSYIPGEGLAIYHIDASQSTNANENRRLVEVEQADGDEDLNGNGNSGDNGDLFPGSSNNDSFSCDTSPNSNTYDGGSSNIKIFNISESGTSVSFDYDFCTTDCLVGAISRNGGITNYGGGTYDQSFIVSYLFPPGSGSLEVSAAGVTQTFSITTSPQAINLSGLPADGLPVSVTATFTAEVECSLSVTDLYIAPKDCLNDNVCDAFDITANIDGEAVLCSNLGASSQANEPRPNAIGCNVQNGWCENTLHNTVWFSFAAPASGSIDIDFNTAIDLQMALWEADNCSDLFNSDQRMLVAANDDSGSAGGFSPRLINLSCLIPGKTYYVQIDGWNGASGTFSMSLSDPGINCTVAPTNTGGCGTTYNATSNGNGEWIHITDGSGNRIVSINDMFNNLGTISVDYNLHTGVIRQDEENYPVLDRDWQITVANNAAATVRLYLTEQELQDLIDSGGALSLEDIDLLKRSSGTCGDPIAGVSEVLESSYTMGNFSGSNHLLEFEISGFSNFFGRSNVAILPLELSYFNGVAEAKHNLLRWASSREVNTKIHEIERLVEGETAWEVIGQLPAAGNSDQEVKYQWMDHRPFPMSFYRIKTIDFDGSFDYTPIISLERKQTEFQLSAVYPIPAQTNIQTEWYSPESSQVEWTIRSSSGQVILNGQIPLSSGRTRQSIDVSALPSGVYWLQYQQDDRLEVKRIVVD
ncbi:MAG: M6 family metalloprotease domain-containing protein [Bacteroidota bacterium]